MIDQRKLPVHEVYVRRRTAQEVARAIKTMVIRGAPAIGGRGSGDRAGMRNSKATGTQKFAAEFFKVCELMAGTWPTAVNLFWAIERMKRAFAAAAGNWLSKSRIGLDREAQAIHDEDAGELPGDRRLRRRSRARRRADSHALQCRRAGHCWGTAPHWA